jgi:hypothetical protein
VIADRIATASVVLGGTGLAPAGHDYGQYVRDVDNAGVNDIAQFFRDVMAEDS